METKEIFAKLHKHCPIDYRINEIIIFAYPYRRVIVNATVNTTPEQSLQQIYSILLRTIEAGFDTEEKIINFLGLHEEDFILRELYFLRERGYLDFVSNIWMITQEGINFIKDNTILKRLEKENFEFLIDGITQEVVAKESKLYSNYHKENKLKSNINIKIKDPSLLKDKFVQLANIYKTQNDGKAYLVDYDQNIIFDKEEYQDYCLIEYIPSKAKENELEPFIEVRNIDQDFSKNNRLTKIFQQEYPEILYQLTNSDRNTFAELEKQKDKFGFIQQFKTTPKDDTLSDAKELSIWETQAKFKEALSSVKKKILIESPWIKRATLKYIELFQKALEKKVIVIILYGIEGNDKHHDFTIKKLQELQSKYSNFHLVHLPEHLKNIGNKKMIGTHRKLLIKDDEYYIEGSFNFLSFNKERWQKVANEESILISKNTDKKWYNVFKEYQLDEKIIK